MCWVFSVLCSFFAGALEYVGQEYDAHAEVNNPATNKISKDFFIDILV